jgi:hypothetical protein
MKNAQKSYNEWFMAIASKTCPGGCNRKLRGDAKLQVYARGCYVHGKWRTLDYFCANCFKERIIPAMKFAAINTARVSVSDVVLCARSGCGPLPTWMITDWRATLPKEVHFSEGEYQPKAPAPAFKNCSTHGRFFGSVCLECPLEGE